MGERSGNWAGRGGQGLDYCFEGHGEKFYIK